MEASSPRSRIGGSWTSQLLTSRRGGLTVAAISALIAGILLYLFVQHYKKNNSSSATTAASYVFVAGKVIPQGTPASTVVTEGLLQKVSTKTEQPVAGAITDASQITGAVAATNIAANQQITAADFTRAQVSIASYLTGTQRALALSLDPTHGLTSYVTPGDHVDIMATIGGQTQVLAQNVTVLANANGDLIIRVTDKQSLEMATANDASKIWITLRPPTGAQQSVSVGSKAGV